MEWREILATIKIKLTYKLSVEVDVDDISLICSDETETFWTNVSRVFVVEHSIFLDVCNEEAG